MLCGALGHPKLSCDSAADWINCSREIIWFHERSNEQRFLKTLSFEKGSLNALIYGTYTCIFFLVYFGLMWEDKKWAS